MSSLSVVGPKAYRFNLAVTPNTLLYQVLEKACLSGGYDPDKFGLKFHGKWVDLSNTFRLSGLPNNATLELAKNELNAHKKVSIGLQFPDSRREQAEFPLNATLANVLEAFSEKCGTDLVSIQKKTDQQMEVPTVTYMTNKDLTMFPLTTLKSMGIFDKTIVRYSRETYTADGLRELEKKAKEVINEREHLHELYLQRKADIEERACNDRAQEQEVIERHLQECRERERRADAVHNATELPTNIPPETRLTRLETILNRVNESLDAGRVDDLADQLLDEQGRIQLEGSTSRLDNFGSFPPNEFANFKFPDEDAILETATQSSSSPGARQPNDPLTPVERKAILFVFGELASAGKTEPSEEGDEFYELGTEDVKKLLRVAKEQTNRQRILLPQKFIEQKDRELMSIAYKHTVVRFRLFNHCFLQALFRSNEPVSSLFDFIRSMLLANTGFDLYLVPEKLQPNSQTLVNAGLAPKCSILVKFTDVTLNAVEGLLRMELILCGTEETAKLTADKWLGVNTLYRPYLWTLAQELVPNDPMNGKISANASAAGRDVVDEEGSKRESRHLPANLPKWFK